MKLSRCDPLPRIQASNEKMSFKTDVWRGVALDTGSKCYELAECIKYVQIAQLMRLHI